MPGPIGPSDVRPSGLVIDRDERGYVTQIVVEGERLTARGASEELCEADALDQLVSLCEAEGVLPRLLADRTIPNLRARLG
jgi:hypothetical protein